MRVTGERWALVALWAVILATAILGPLVMLVVGMPIPPP